METYDEFRQRVNDLHVHLTAQENVETNKKVTKHLGEVMRLLTLVEFHFYEIRHIKGEEE